GGPRTGKPSDRYVPPVSGGTKNLGGCCSRKEEEGSDSSVRAAGEGGGCGVSVRSAQRWLRLRAREAAAEAVLVGGRSRGERRGCAWVEQRPRKRATAT
ncbi:hypothetical protein B296_00023440, partial [Ensete ventricosum]